MDVEPAVMDFYIKNALKIRTVIRRYICSSHLVISFFNTPNFNCTILGKPKRLNTKFLKSKFQMTKAKFQLKTRILT
jgi:hypothetical protein